MFSIYILIYVYACMHIRYLKFDNLYSWIHPFVHEGLLPLVSGDQETSVQQGQFGIASTYKRYEKTENTNEKTEEKMES
jgi:hypothetical protein